MGIFTKHHYEAVAEVLAHLDMPLEDLLLVVADFVKMFQKDNDIFNKDRFMRLIEFKGNFYFYIPEKQKAYKAKK